MGLESGNFIGNLVPSNPLGTDAVSDGDGHLRLIKDVLIKTFGAWAKAYVPAPTGAVIAFQAAVAPDGFIVADGGLYSKTTYAELWAWVQTFGVIKSEVQWQSGGYRGAYVDYDAGQFRIPELYNRAVVGPGSLLPGQDGRFEAQLGTGAILFYVCSAWCIATGKKS